MSGVEISIPLTLVATIQFIGLGAKYLLDFRIKRLSTISDAYIVGIMLLVFNVLRIIQGQHNSIFDSIAFAILCGFTSTLLFQNEIRTRIRFLIIACSNSILFIIVLMLSKRISGIGFFNQILLMAVALNVYFASYSLITFFKLSESRRHYIPRSKVLLISFSLIFAFGTLLLPNDELKGVLTANFLFLVIIGLEFVRYYSDKYEERVLFVRIETKVEESLPEEKISLETTIEEPSADAPELIEPKIEDFDLTQRQLEVARLLLKRMSRTQIATQLGIEDATVGYHTHQIFKKTETFSRTDFILKFRHQVTETTE